MPVVPPKEGELERRNVYTRLNPQGHEERVVKRQGHPDEETLNELAEDLLGLLESVSFGGLAPSMGNDQENYQRSVNQTQGSAQVASRGDQLRATDETLTNMTVAPPNGLDSGLGMGPMPADSPEESRAKSPLSATPLGGKAISKYNMTQAGDGLDDGATYSESFTGTGAIAFAPVALGSAPPDTGSRQRRKKRDENKDTSTPRLENRMSTRRTINEWLPPFKANGYAPGDGKMPSPTGKGVAARETTQDDVGAYDTELSGSGKEWPREHSDNVAMDGVDDENISNSAEGAHESTHGEPTDGHQKKIADLNLRTSQKNTGSGVAEPFGGDRWSDGGVLPQGQGPGADTWTHEEGPGMPSDGPITGTNGPQLGQPANEGKGWTPSKMARMMGEDFDVQGLFNSYARNASAVCVEDFQALCDAHGAEIVLDESSMLSLMGVNNEFMFYEGRDTDGPYWVPKAITEGENRRPFAEGKKRGRRTINEMQIRSPEEEAGLFTSDGPGGMGELDGIEDMAGMQGGDPDMDMGGGLPGMQDSGVPGVEGMGSEYDDRLGAGNDFDDHPSNLADAREGMMGMGPDEMSTLECSGCGYQGEDAECPECGGEMMDPMSNMASVDGGDPIENVAAKKWDEYDEASDYGFDPDTEKLKEYNQWTESRRVHNSPQIVESLKNFMVSAKSLIGRNPQANRRDLAEALNHSWSYHAGDVDARTCPSKVKQTLEGLMRKFPGFTPLNENDAMDRPEGTKLGGGDGPKVNLPQQPTDMKTHGDKSLLGKDQNGKAMGKSGKDGIGGEPWLAGTERKLTGKSVSESFGTAGAPAPQGAAPAARQQRPQRPQGRPQQQVPAQNPTAPVQSAAPQQQAAGQATTQVQENIARLARHVKHSIQEAAQALGRGKFSVSFSVLVAESKGPPAFLKDKGKDDKKSGKKGGESFGGKKAPPFGGDKKSGKKDDKPDFLKGKGKSKKNRTPPRDNLAEALADAEEILQLHSPQNVTFEATFYGTNGQVALKQDIPLFTIGARGPMVGEGKALFRFHRNAEAFADQLVAEGVTCRVLPHNWGSAVQARTSYRVADQVFKTLAECNNGCGTRRR